MKVFTVFALLTLSYFCQAQNKVNYNRLAQEYFHSYQQRTDFESFLNFYHADVEFIDILSKVELNSKQQFADFYDWQKGHFDRLDNKHILRLDNLVVDDDTAVARGVFLPFKYNGKRMGPWDFVIWLEFDQQGKIIRQQDWINYSQNEAQ